MEGFTKEALTRVPLADGVLSLLAFVLDPEFLQGVFEEHRGRSYEATLSFPTMVSVVQEALLEHGGSGHQAMTRSRKREELNASIQAAYGKLRRIPISLSLGFLAGTSDRVREVFPEGASNALPASLDEFDVYAVDGKKIKNVAKRLKPARSYSGTPLGGKALAALNLRRGSVEAINAHPDGETNDAPLVPDLLPQVRARSTRRRLWVADRQFCDLVQTARFAEANDAFLIRYHPKNSFHRDPERAVREGTDAQGRSYLEEWGYLGKASDPRRQYVRRITLFRADGEDVVLVTNLLDADKYPATDLLETYLQRWGIERVFQQVTEVFHLQHLISSTPEGTIFQFAFCVLMYNLVQTVRAYIARAQNRRAETISSEQLFYDVHRQLTALSVFGDRATILDYFQPSLTAAQLKLRLEQLFQNTWEDYWVKSPATKRKPPGEKKTIQGGHTSIFRILRDARHSVP